MRTTVDIEAQLLKRLRAEAHRQGVSVKTLLNRALRRPLEERRVAAKPYRCPSFAMGAPVRPLDKALAIADALQEEEIAQRLALRQ